MPLDPSKSLHFDSWEKLIDWLPQATEEQLITVFVWSNEAKRPGVDARRLGHVRTLSFEHLVERTAERLKRFLVARLDCRDGGLAEDVVQQVLIKLYLRAEQFDPKRAYWGWLYQIAKNEYIDTLRRTRAGDIGVGQIGLNDDEYEQWLSGFAQTEATPESDLLLREKRQILQNVIDTLPTTQRAVVRLKLEELKGKEIAKRLKISQAYVSQLFHEALAYLRDTLEE